MDKFPQNRRLTILNWFPYQEKQRVKITAYSLIWYLTLTGTHLSLSHSLIPVLIFNQMIIGKSWVSENQYTHINKKVADGVSIHSRGREWSLPCTINISIFIQNIKCILRVEELMHLNSTAQFCTAEWETFFTVIDKGHSSKWWDLEIVIYFGLECKSTICQKKKKKVVEACFINTLLLFLDYTPVEAHIWNDTSDMLYTR